MVCDCGDSQKVDTEHGSDDLQSNSLGANVSAVSYIQRTVATASWFTDPFPALVSIRTSDMLPKAFF
jgi:hypothetical protein